MGNEFGRTLLDQVGVSISVCADSRPQWKLGGISVDWSTVSAVGADTYLQDGFFVPNGEKYLRYGQVLCQITANQQIQTVTVTGTPTGGTFTLSGTRPDTGSAFTATINYNSTAAQAQAVFDAAVGVGNTTLGGGALPGSALTVTWNGAFGNSPATMTVSTNALTGGTSPAVAVTVSQAGNTSGGKWGPYDPSASDGRQTLVKGTSFILERSVREIDTASNHPPALQGGLLWKGRLLATAGTHSLAAGPTYTELEGVFPTLRYAGA